MLSERINDKSKLKDAARELIQQFPNEKIFAFYGKMGAGKTTYIQAICRYLGSDDNITSPTFALINEYKTREQKSIFHFDFYRIKDLEEVYDLGYEDYMYSGNYCLIEWPELIESLLPENIVRVKIEVGEDEARIISANK